MSKLCSTCGSGTALEARFCRMCGTPFDSGIGETASVSPTTATISFEDERRATDGLAAEDPWRRAPDTSRVDRAEMEELLLRPSRAETIFHPDESVRGTSISYETPNFFK